MLKTLSKIALDYDKGDAWMLANLFENIEKVKFIWEYIWLSYTIRSEKSNEQMKGLGVYYHCVKAKEY